MVGEGVSARLLAGAGAVLRREGLVRALDLAARGPLGHPGAVLGFVAVLVPRRGIFAPVPRTVNGTGHTGPRIWATEGNRATTGSG